MSDYDPVRLGKETNNQVIKINQSSFLQQTREVRSLGQGMDFYVEVLGHALPSYKVQSVQLRSEPKSG